MNLTARAGAGLALTLVVPPPPVVRQLGGERLVVAAVPDHQNNPPVPENLDLKNLAVQVVLVGVVYFLGVVL